MNAAAMVREIAGLPANGAVRETRINARVTRLHCTTNGSVRSFVAKRLNPDIARRNELVVRRWLPAVGLGDLAPVLLAVAAEADGSTVWHLYEDLGDHGLDASQPAFGGIARAVAAIARIHTRFSGHPLIPECRLWGGDLGISFYDSSVRDAITALEAMPVRRSQCDRLRATLDRLLDERERRADLLASAGGPETLLHGDLWPMNVMVGSTWVRLIDWDHAGVGPVTYDLSTFLSRFPIAARVPILRLYEEHAAHGLPTAAVLNAAFETAELARIANRVIWPALAAWENDAPWALEALAEVESWFAQLTPLLPLDA